MQKTLLLSLAVAAGLNASALDPSREYSTTPDKHNLAFKEFKVRTKDGAQLHTWWFQNPKVSKNNIIISTSGDGNMADNIELVTQFLSAGYNVLTYDYRGYGKSSDFVIDPEIFVYPEFVTDLNAVCDTLRFLAKVTKFDLYGIQIGAGLSLAVGARRMDARKIIAEAPWTDLQKMKDKIKKVQGEDINLHIGYDKNDEPIYALVKPKTRIRILILVSAKDPMIGPDDMKEIKKLKSMDEALEIQTFKTVTNAENFTSDKDAYFKRITEFLKKV